MIEKSQLKNEEWYKQVSNIFVDILETMEASSFDAMIVLSKILKSTIYSNVSEDVSESDLLEIFKKVYDSIEIHKNDEVKKE